MSTLTKQDPFSRLLESAPTNFTAARILAKECYLAQGIPLAKAEEYKFTNVGKKLEQNITNFFNADSFEVSEELIKSSIFEGFKGDVLVFSNGKFLPAHSAKIKGIEVSVLSEKSDLALGSIAKPEKDPFAALNQASFENGIFISIPKKAQILKPILLLFFNQANEGQVIQPRVGSKQVILRK